MQVRYAATDAWASLCVYEALRKLPAVPQPSPAAPAAAPQPPPPEGGCDAGGALAASLPSLPPLATPTRLQPAKLAVLHAHMAGATAAEIATARRIREDTALSYLAEAVLAGYGVRWEALGVPPDELAHVAQVAGRLLGRALSYKLQPPTCATFGQGPDPGSGQQQQQQQPHQSSQQLAPRDAALVSRRAPADLLQRLAEAGTSVRALREEHLGGDGEALGYGHLRLALAYLGRCNPEPWG